jgi:GTP-binding protein
MFLDEVEITVASGRGGDGAVHFRREKFVPRGGPDGGNGGRGGHVILEVIPTLNTLTAFRHRRTYRAADGERGGRSDRTGKEADDLTLHVPPGTLVRDAVSGDLLGDLKLPGEHLRVCRGGRGGRGNARFANSRNQAPRMAERGEPGTERRLVLELRLIADVGIIGVPNAGKSTLLSALTNARPKIADYPFTTLQPNLGVARLDEETSIVLADIPGLLEGAHQGIGLGSTFLRHIQRTRALIHLIDGESQDPVADFSQVNAELALFDPRLKARPQVVAVNKIDQPDVLARLPELEARFRQLGVRVLRVSALARTGSVELLRAAVQAMLRAAPEPEADQVPVYRPDEEATAFRVEAEGQGTWRVRGQAIERAAEMTYWEFPEAVRRFQRILERLGVDDALRRAGAKQGDNVRIGGYELEWQD